MSFTHLHVHSEYSLLDGMSKINQLVDKCIKYQMPAMALTDHGNMYGIKIFLDYCKKVNADNKKKWDETQMALSEDQRQTFVPFKPIVGVEAYCARRHRNLRDKDVKDTTGEGRTYTVDMSGWHLILLAKNELGYRNLCKMVSESFMDECFYRTARIDKELLAQYHEGVICSSACLGGELSQKILANRIEEAEEAILWFKNLFGEDYYIEIQRHQTDKPHADQHTYQVQKRVNPILIELAHKHNVKVIATNDVHFVDEEHSEAHDRLICLSTDQFVDNEDRMHYTKQEWLKSPEEMQDLFADIPEAITNTQEIADKVEVYDIDSGPLMPKFPIPETFGTEETYRQRISEQELFKEFTEDENGKTILSEEQALKKIKQLGGYDKLYRIKLEADYLAYLTWEGAKKRYPELAKQLEQIGEKGLYQIGWDMQGLAPHECELVERIKFELHTMKTMGFPGYFLIVMDFIRAAREELDVSVGPGRGSAAGSVVAYCLRITDLDPLEYDLLFERFLNPDRISLPDIDTDFDDAGRGKVLDWVSEKYGHTQVAHIITYGVMASKSAIADVGRVQRVPLPEVNHIKSLIPSRGFPDNIKDEKGKSPKVNLKNCYTYVDELKDMLKHGNENIQSMLHYAQQLEDTVRQVGIHACGVIIGADDLTNFVPLSTIEDRKTNKRILVTEYDGHVVESVGLIKMDFLGLKTLTIIKETLSNIKKSVGIDVDVDHLPKDDADTYKLFQEGRTIAVFQFESPGMQKYLKELKPTVMGDLIAMNALYRPGPMAYIPQFIRRKQGLEPVTYDIPVMEKYLKDTYGITVYQEQVMLLSRLLANFTRGESDKLRKAMGKKQIKVLEELKGKFMDGGKQNGHDATILEKIWKDWEAFASYAFNKSHAACYSWVAYQTAYLKAHYPAAFLAANLTVSKDDITTVTKLMQECRSMHINVLEPDVNESELNFTVNQSGDIRFGLGGILGVGEGAVEAIILEREKNGKYKDIYDFIERVNLQACNRKTIEALALSGAFDSFTHFYREQLVNSGEEGSKGLDILMQYGSRYQQDKLQRGQTIFDMFGDADLHIQKPALPLPERSSTIERLNIEKDLIGIYLSEHPLDEYAFEIQKLCNIDSELLNLFAGWSKPEARTAADLPSDEEEQEGASKKITPQEFIKRYTNIPLRFGGIITSSEELVSKSNNPYGRYTIEDYSGHYTFVVFGSAYRQFAPLLKKDLYIQVSGSIQQRGHDFRGFVAKPANEAVYELNIKNVEMLKDVQDKQMTSLNILLPLYSISPEFMAELNDICNENPGNHQLKIKLINPLHSNSVQMFSRKYHVHIGRHFYNWLQEKQENNILFYRIE